MKIKALPAKLLVISLGEELSMLLTIMLHNGASITSLFFKFQLVWECLSLQTDFFKQEQN